MSASWGFDFWQSTERLHCKGATLLLVLRATCCFNEVQAAQLSKQILLSAFGGLFNSFSFKSSIFTSCMKEVTITHFCAIVDNMNQKQFHLEWLHLLHFLFLLPLYFVHHKHFFMPLRFQQTCTFLVGPCGKPLLSVCTERIPAAPFSFQKSPGTCILLSSPDILNYLNLLECRSCLGLVTYLVRGKAR